MKKISIVLAILAVFLVFSCSNAAGAVDTAGNPVDLAGSWSGTVAYKSGVKYVRPVAMVDVDTSNAEKWVDYTGTWVKEEVLSEPDADYVQVSTDKVDKTVYTTRNNYFYNGDTKTKTTTRVIASDGSYVETVVENTSHKARAKMTVPKDTGLVTNYYFIDGTRYTSGEVIDAVKGGVETTTTTKTVTFAKNADGKTYDITTVTQTDTAQSGDLYQYPHSTTKTETSVSKGQSSLDFSAVGATDSGYKQTVKSARKPVEYLNDITETLTLEVAKDGTYTLKSVAVETQAAAAAAAETETAYAAGERKAATLTYTTTTKGTVAAWETTTSDNGNILQVAFSSSAKTVEVAGTENFKDKSKTTIVSKFADGKYNAKLLKGISKDKEVAAKTRLYLNLVGLKTDAAEFDDAASNIIIFDKAPEAAK